MLLKDLETNKYCRGLYTWTGSEWILLSNEKEEVYPTVTDIEGNVYRYKQFGDLYWMIDNVRALKVNTPGEGLLAGDDLPDYKFGDRPENMITGVGVVLGRQTEFVTTNKATFFKKQTDIDAWKGGTDINGTLNNSNMWGYDLNGVRHQVSINDFINKFGFAYTKFQAQLVCPAEWRLPTADDNSNLPTETLGGDWGKLVTYLISQHGGDMSTMGFHLKADKSSYKPWLEPNSPGFSWGGGDACDPEAGNSGFEALGTGFINGSVAIRPNRGAEEEFGRTAAWWSVGIGTNSSAPSPTGVRLRVRDLTGQEAKELNKFVQAVAQMGYHVRCVKNVQ